MNKEKTMKNIILAALIAATAVPAVAATDNLGAQQAVANSGHVELDRVMSTTGGYVEILDGSSIETGVLLGLGGYFPLLYSGEVWPVILAMAGQFRVTSCPWSQSMRAVKRPGATRSIAPSARCAMRRDTPER